MHADTFDAMRARRIYDVRKTASAHTTAANSRQTNHIFDCLRSINHSGRSAFSLREVQVCVCVCARVCEHEAASETVNSFDSFWDLFSRFFWLFASLHLFVHLFTVHHSSFRRCVSVSRLIALPDRSTTHWIGSLDLDSALMNFHLCVHFDRR